MALRPRIDAEKCITCGQCAVACPSRIFVRGKDRITLNPVTADHCFTCGQCMAVCPTEAVVSADFDYAAFAELPGSVPDAETLRDLFVTRRSVRHFTDEPVAREDLERVLELTAMAPMGVPPPDVEALVFGRREQIEELLPYTFRTYEELFQQLKSPIGRFLIRREIGADMLHAIEEHLGPFVGPMVAAYREHGIDCATWGAAAMLVFHASRRSLSGKENCLIASAYAALAAHSLGLGATIIGVIPPVIDRSRELRTKYGIPDENEVVISVILGHPAVTYRRAIPRRLKSVSWLA